MNTQAPSFNTAELAERMAWMHEPVHLSRARLPWFLRWMLEQALHRMFCRLEQGLLLLMELQRQGKLELVPVAAEAAQAPRRSRYKMKSPPVVPSHGAGCSAVPQLPEKASAPATDAEAAEASRTGAQTQALLVPAPLGIAMRQRPKLSAFAASASCSVRRTQQPWGYVARHPDRCRRSTFPSPVAGCGRIVSKSFRLLN